MKIIVGSKTISLNEKVFEKMNYNTAKKAVMSVTGMSNEEFADDILADLGKSEDKEEKPSVAKKKASKKSRK